MELIELNANIRTTTGNGPARVLRSAGRTPAVLYGPKIDTVQLSVDTKEMEQILKETASSQVLLELKVHNGETYSKTVIVKELQIHPTSEVILHADFYVIEMDQVITVNVAVETVGKSVGVEEGGLLQILRRELEVTCLPANIPESIKVDISELSIGDSLHIKSIELPEGVEIITESDFTVLTVVSAAIEVEEPEEEEIEGEEVEGETEEGGEEADKDADAKDADTKDA